MLKNWFCLAVTALILVSCTPKNSGPCDYLEFRNVKCKVISITPKANASDEFDILLEFEESSLASEPQNLGERKGVKTTQEFIDKNRIELGLVYTCDVNELKPGTGNCDPLVIGWNNKFVEVE